MLIIDIRYILVRRSLAPDISTYINKGFPNNQETVFIHILRASFFLPLIHYASSKWLIEPDCKYTMLVMHYYWNDLMIDILNWQAVKEV